MPSGSSKYHGSDGRCAAKGAIGETLLIEAADRLLPTPKYRRFDDVTLPTVYGTAQIDHVVVSRFGVFVIETKNWSGWIFGRENEHFWTQHFRGGDTNQLRNPLQQNKGHVDAVVEELRVPEGVVHSVIAFVGGASLKKPMPPGVTTGERFAAYVTSFSTQVLSAAQVGRICAALESVRRPPRRAARRAHIRSAKCAAKRAG